MLITQGIAINQFNLASEIPLMGWPKFIANLDNYSPPARAFKVYDDDRIVFAAVPEIILKLISVSPGASEEGWRNVWQSGRHFNLS